MGDESINLPIEQNIDFYIVTLLDRLEAMRRENVNLGHHGLTGARLLSTLPKRSMQSEIRTLEFWRSIICECLASFFYVFIVCGAAAGAGVGASVSSVLLATALASGLAITTLTQCFKNISGAHINPSITLGACVIRAITPLRAAMYITAQCGGGIAGAALLYGVTVPGYQGNLQAAISHSSALAAWERFGVEFILTFIVVLTYFVSMDSYKKYLGNVSITVGAAYSACSFVSMPYLNPARSLGPSFVLNKWDNHWVYWFGPLVGGAASALIYEYIFNSRRGLKKSKDNLENDSTSIHSEDDLNYDMDIEKPSTLQNPKMQSSTYRSQKGQMSNQVGYCQNFYTTAPLPKFEQPEPLYGGTRSMYCRSPPLTRANLNRSQSVYTKSQTAINRDTVRPGPLVPAQSLYPLRTTQQTQSSHLQNQNVQNQMQQRSESIYGIRASSRSAIGTQQHQHQQHQQQQQQQQPQPIQNQHQQSERTQENQRFQPVYGTRQNTNPNDNMKFENRTLDSKEHRSNRPESMYGMSVGQRGRGQSAQSDDSSYGSYHGSAATPPARNANGEILNYGPPPGVSTQIRTQSERKISATITSTNGNTQQPTNGERQKPVNYTTQNQTSMYGLLPMRQQI